jgi:hypothetical protein
MISKLPVLALAKLRIASNPLYIRTSNPPVRRLEYSLGSVIVRLNVSYRVRKSVQKPMRALADFIGYISARRL